MYVLFGFVSQRLLFPSFCHLVTYQYPEFTSPTHSIRHSTAPSIDIDAHSLTGGSSNSCGPSCNPQLKYTTSALYLVPFGEYSHCSTHCTPYAVSSAPPSPLHGPCWTNASSAMIDATVGVYPMLTLSPMMSTFLSVVEASNGGPGLQTHTPCVASAEGVLRCFSGSLKAAVSFCPKPKPKPKAGSQVVTTPHEGQLGSVWSTHLVPDGQQVNPF